MQVDLLFSGSNRSRLHGSSLALKRPARPYVTCYKLVNGVLHPTRDFTGAAESDDISGRLSALGYKRQMRSGRRHLESGRLTVWKSTDPRLPPFYVEVAGATQALAVLVAADFAQLAATLRHLTSLIDLIGAGSAHGHRGIAGPSAPAR